MNSFELENSLKYGNKNTDILSQVANINKTYSIMFCIVSVQKYATRYKSTSLEKSFNDKDLDKILDYTNRALELSDKQTTYSQIENIINCVNAFIEEKKQGKFNSTHLDSIIDSCLAIYYINTNTK